jgi:hypothetical protein
VCPWRKCRAAGLCQPSLGVLPPTRFRGRRNSCGAVEQEADSHVRGNGLSG